MKKLFALSIVAGMLFVACGPSAAEKAAEEQRVKDSIAKVEAEQAAAEEAAKLAEEQARLEAEAQAAAEAEANQATKSTSTKKTTQTPSKKEEVKGEIAPTTTAPATETKKEDNTPTVTRRR